MEFVVLDFGDFIREADRLERGAAVANNFSAPLTQIGLDMLVAEEQVFASQGRRGGGSWKKLAPSTVKRKGSFRILETDGANPGYSDPGSNALKNSVTRIGAPFQVLIITNNTIEFGTDRPYADAQQWGTRDGHIPARPFIRFTPYDVNKWTNRLWKHIMRPFSVG